MSKNILSIKNLYIKKGNKNILSDISFSITHPQIVGIIGENGAGKTTLFKSLIGIERPNSGTIALHNWKFSGHLIEYPKFYNYLSGLNNLKITNNYNKNRVDLNKIIYSHNLENYVFKKVSTYSLGMKQKLGFINSLLLNGDIIVLDEPTNGLDPKVKKDILNSIVYYKEIHKKVFLISSHNLEDLEEICDRYIFLESGSITKDIEIENLRKERDKYNLIKTSSSNDCFYKKLLSNNFFVEMVNGYIKILKKDTDQILKLIINENLHLIELKPYHFDLKEFYFNS